MHGSPIKVKEECVLLIDQILSLRIQLTQNLFSFLSGKDDEPKQFTYFYDHNERTRAQIDMAFDLARAVCFLFFCLTVQY